MAVTSAYNLIGTGGGGGLTNGTNGNQVAVTNPGIASALANNGGPTQTIALLAGSPAIDAGSNALAVDAEGDRFFTISAAPATRASSTRLSTSAPTSGHSPRRPPSNRRPTRRVFGETVTFTATVTPVQSSSITPTGTVTFYVGTSIAKVAPLLNGVATFTTSSLPQGGSTIMAVYSGNLTYADSSSATLTQTVNQALTTITLNPAVSPNPASSGVVALTSSASVGAITASAGASTGVVSKSHGKSVKKVTISHKAKPHAGSATKFHQSKQSAALKKVVVHIAKHATVKAKKTK